MNGVIAVLAIFLAGAPAARPQRFVPAEAMASLDCVEAWEQLCAPMQTPDGQLIGPAFTIEENRVVASVDMDLKVEFQISRRTPTTLELQLASWSDGSEVPSKGAKATLNLRGENARFVGIDPRGLRSARPQRVRLELVPADAVAARQSELVKKLVPGGKCEGLTTFKPSPPDKRTCLKPGDAPKAAPRP